MSHIWRTGTLKLQCTSLLFGFDRRNSEDHICFPGFEFDAVIETIPEFALRDRVTLGVGNDFVSGEI